MEEGGVFDIPVAKSLVSWLILRHVSPKLLLWNYLFFAIVYRGLFSCIYGGGGLCGHIQAWASNLLWPLLIRVGFLSDNIDVRE